MKHAFWWLLAVIGLGIAAVSFLAEAPSAAKEGEASAVSFMPLTAGVSTTTFGRVDYRITSGADLAKLWKMLGTTSTMPAIDFDTEEVIAVFAPASAVQVSSIKDAATREVEVEVHACGTASSTAYELVSVPATALPYAHEDAAGGC